MRDFFAAQYATADLIDLPFGMRNVHFDHQNTGNVLALLMSSMGRSNKTATR
jgi:hypothetical protein